MATEQWVETRDADPCGNSAHIRVPKRFHGKPFRAELVDESEEWRETLGAKACGNSAHILLPKRFRGKQFRVELLPDRHERGGNGE
ncbi:hypothetical protein SAMN05444422_101472 [Halobiforma haloterrestris]|uniref:Uncharacterized protein n=1 Tax=Natronobacterium haloterrestre TaxID=148448 RepID=A0A1I1DI36_NATHA|nr:DUF2080 family transposase-associated protein [Halobiforma haloterrestris]SFB72173.1 hypothetical protein SAMN05444422_101472 [Halobiforma haloterrestris]